MRSPFLVVRGVDPKFLKSLRGGIEALDIESQKSDQTPALTRFSHTGSDFRAAAAGRITEGLKERGL